MGNVIRYSAASKLFTVSGQHEGPLFRETYGKEFGETFSMGEIYLTDVSVL